MLNEGTEHELRRPFEVFINSKNMEHFQWIVALTLIISAVFRKGGDVTFLVHELRSVFDPRGGYFKKGGKYMPSLVAEIGDAIESHMRHIGLLTREDLDERQQDLIAKKRREYEAAVASRGSCRRIVDGRIPVGSAVVRALRYQGGGADGRMHDLPELRGLEMRLRGSSVVLRKAPAHAKRGGYALGWSSRHAFRSGSCGGRDGRREGTRH